MIGLTLPPLKAPSTPSATPLQVLSIPSKPPLSAPRNPPSELPIPVRTLLRPGMNQSALPASPQNHWKLSLLPPLFVTCESDVVGNWWLEFRKPYPCSAKSLTIPASVPCLASPSDVMPSM